MQKNKHALLLSALISLLIVLVIYPLFYTGFTTQDDSMNAVKDFNIFQIIQAARNSGRINPFASMLLFKVPYLFDNFLYTKSMTVIPIIISFLLFTYTIYLYSKSKKLALLTLVVLVSTLQFSWNHSLLTSYPFSHTVTWCAFLLSCITFYKYIHERKRLYIWITIGLYFFSLCLYEMYVPFIAIYCVFLHIETIQNKENIYRKYKKIVPLALTLCMYLALYISFRTFFAIRVYSGAELHINSMESIERALTTMFQYSLVAFPTNFLQNINYQSFIYNYFQTISTPQISFLYILMHAQAEWIVLSIISSFLVAHILMQKAPHIHIPFRSLFILGIAFLFLPNLVISFTPKYQDWVQRGDTAFLTTFFSMFGSALIISVLCIFIYKKISRSNRILFFACIIIIMFRYTLITSYANSHIIQSQILSNRKWQVIDAFIQTDEFKNIPDGVVLYAPTLWNHKAIMENTDNYWTEYIKRKSKKNVTINSKTICTRCVLYYLQFSQEKKQDNQYLVFAKVNREDHISKNRLFSNRMHMYMYSKNKTYLLSFSYEKNKRTNISIKIDGQEIPVESTHTSSIIIDGTNSEKKLGHNVIEAPSIDLTSTHISYFID